MLRVLVLVIFSLWWFIAMCPVQTNKHQHHYLQSYQYFILFSWKNT